MADSVNNEILRKFGDDLLGNMAELMKDAGNEKKKKEREAEDEKPPNVSSKGIQKSLDFNFKIKNILTKAAANGELEEAVKQVQELLKARNGELLLLDSDPSLLQTKEKLEEKNAKHHAVSKKKKQQKARKKGSPKKGKKKTTDPPNRFFVMRE
ncbi:hypothetical protein B9Z55_011594 [Caenorhabditis nigoni]|uniref:Uncharacterized protein n=1 Tax=Caenorhabditis nigoni TaxID=1611254 RepID=A0A2G5UKT2_9PELO|nr:hypothetical protein B9Z55_011594 [Caenorhabditis nigoni]